MPKKIEISHRTVVFTVFFLLFLWFLYFILDLILEVFLATLLMAIFNPLVKRLSKYKIPQAVSVLITYFLALGIVVGTIASLVPALLEQTTNFVNGVPGYVEKLEAYSLFGNKVFGEALTQLGSVPAQFAKFIGSLLSNVLGVFTVLIFAFYLLLARDKLDDQLGFFFGEERKKEIGKTIDVLEKKLGGWARGQLALMLIVGTATYIGLVLLRIPYALPLSILAGFLEIVPYIGPFVAAIPAIIIGFGISTAMGFATTALVVVIQQVENYVLVPKIVEKSAGVSPIITLIAMSIGFRVAGIIGVIISVPIVITVQALSRQYFLAK